MKSSFVCHKVLEGDPRVLCFKAMYVYEFILFLLSTYNSVQKLTRLVIHRSCTSLLSIQGISFSLTDIFETLWLWIFLEQKYNQEWAFLIGWKVVDEKNTFHISFNCLIKFLTLQWTIFLLYVFFSLNMQMLHLLPCIKLNNAALWRIDRKLYYNWTSDIHIINCRTVQSCS